MKCFLLSLLDRLTVTFLYLNVLIPTLPLAGVPLSKLSFGLLLATYGMLMAFTRERIRLRLLLYLLLSHCGMALLGMTSWLQGNEPAAIVGLGSLVLITLIIPPLTLLFRYYGRDRYVQHLSNAIVFLAAAYLTLVILCGPLGQRQVAAYISESGTTFASTISVAFFPGGIRVAITNSGFLPAGLLLAYYHVLSRGRWWDIAGFLIIAAAIYYCYTVSLWASTAFGMIMGTMLLRPGSRQGNARLRETALSVPNQPRLRITRANWRKILIAVCISSGAIVAIARLPEFILGSKKESFEFKQRQMAEAFDTFRASPLTGKGLGYIYSNSDFINVSGAATPLLENSYAVVLASTGLLGLAVFAFIYLYYPFLQLHAYSTAPRLLLLLAHLMVLIQAWGNPFLWSGGLALIFASFLGADLEEIPLVADTDPVSHPIDVRPAIPLT